MLANKFAHKGIDNPGTLAAKDWQKKSWKGEIQKLAKAGKKRHSHMRDEHRIPD